MKKLLVVLVMVTAFTLVYLGCGNSGTGPSEETYTVSGTLTKLDMEDGVMGYAMLITMEGDTTYNLIYSDESPFSAGVASYSMSGVAAGTYYFGAVIDVNGNWESSNGPDEGDWANEDFSEVTINQNTVINVTNDGWKLWSGGGGNNCVSGTLLKNGVEDGVLGYVALADSGYNYQYSAVSEQPFSDGWTTYDIYDVMDGSYFFLAFIDVNGNADPYDPSPDAGDWVNSDPPWVWIDQNTELDVYDNEWAAYGE